MTNNLIHAVWSDDDEHWQIRRLDTGELISTYFGPDPVPGILHCLQMEDCEE